MTSIDDRIKQVMSTEADQFSPPDDLAGTAIRRAGRIRRGRRVAGVLVAAGAVVVAVAIPMAALDSAGPDPSATPTPIIRADREVPPKPGDAAIKQWLAKLPAGTGMRVQHIADGYLRDGDRKARLPVDPIAPMVWSMGRVPDGWVIVIRSSLEQRGYEAIGVLTTSGRFDELAEGEVNGAALSPDGKRLAYAIRAGAQSRAVVVDVATKAEITSVEIAASAQIDGWNQAGIWMSAIPNSANPIPLSRWTPGEAVQDLGPGAVVVASGRTDRMLRRSDGCDKVVTFGPRGFSTVAEYCGFGDNNSLISPDGTVVITPDGVARTIGTDQQTQLDFLPGVPVYGYAWEDGSHVLIRVEEVDYQSTIVRCDIETGQCERAASKKFWALSLGPSN